MARRIPHRFASNIPIDRPAANPSGSKLDQESLIMKSLRRKRSSKKTMAECDQLNATAPPQVATRPEVESRNTLMLRTRRLFQRQPPRPCHSAWFGLGVA